MRDLSDADVDADMGGDVGAAPAAASEPRGRAALGLSPNGMFYDWVLMPMKGRAVTLAARAASVALTVFTGCVLVIAVYSLLN